MTLSIDELPGWFSEQTDDNIEQTQSSIKSKLEEIEDLKKLVKEKLDALAVAELRNKNIPERAKQIMEGSRQTYMNFNKIFLDKIVLPSESGFDAIKELISTYEEASDSLAKSSGRSFVVLQEFFAVESAEVARHIKSIDTNIRSLLANDYSDIMNIQESITDLNRIVKERVVVDDKITGEEKNFAAIEASIKESEHNIELHKQSEKFQELNKFKRDEEEARNKIKQCDEELRALLSPLDKPLKKYERIAVENEKLIQGYLNSSVDALSEDDELDIISVLAKLKTAVDSGSVDVKDNDKVLSKIEEITTEKLENIKQRCIEIKEKLSECNRCIRLNPAARELEELEYKIEHLNDKKRRSEEEMLKLRKQTLKLDSDAVKQRIIDKVKELLNVELEIE